VNLREFQRILLQTVLLPILLLMALAGALIWQLEITLRSERWLDHSDQITANLHELERLIVDRETGLRGYQLTGNQHLLSPFDAAGLRMQEQFDEMSRLEADNPDQQRRLAEIHDRYDLWLGFAQAIMAIPAEQTHDLELNLRGKQLMDDVRRATTAMVDAEEELRLQRFRISRHQVGRTLALILSSSLLVGVVLAYFTWSHLIEVSTAFRAALDESERKAADLFSSRQWFETTLDSIGDGVIACDAEGRIEFMNAVAREITRWPLEEARGLPLDQVFRIVNEETRETAENPVSKVRRLNAVVGLANHTLLIARDGTEMVLDDSASPIRDQHGEMRGIVLIFRDVTETKRTEAALIAGEKLAVAGRLAASIAHEIHNPLDSVANLHFLLMTETDPDRRAEYLLLAQQELGRTLQISRTMLSLYREPKAPIEVNLRELVEGVLLLLERRLQDQRVVVERNFNSVVVEGFPAELRQVFTNLIVNAADAAGEGGRIGILIASATSDEFRSQGAMVEVTDSGPGISGPIEKNLFQPFFTTKGENGTGLGLWVSMGIVQKHGGTIRISNSSNSDLPGAAVRVYLPTHTLATPSGRSTPHVV
jgi:PAS domain S-box-containing protein